MSDVIRKIKALNGGKAYKVDVEDLKRKSEAYAAERKQPPKKQTSFLRQAGTPIHYTDGTSEPAPGPNR